MTTEVKIEIILGIIIILLLVLIRQISTTRSEILQRVSTQPYPTVEITLLPSAIPTFSPMQPTGGISPLQTQPTSSACLSDKDCEPMWCTDAEPPSCYQEKCIGGICTTVQISSHGDQ